MHLARSHPGVEITLRIVLSGALTIAAHPAPSLDRRSPIPDNGRRPRGETGDLPDPTRRMGPPYDTGKNVRTEARAALASEGRALQQERYPPRSDLSV